MRFIVPDEYMIPLGAKATKELGKCADNWSESELQALRAELPMEYHAVPTGALRMRWQNIRKASTPGYKINGHGPAKGSRIKPKRQPPPQWYLDYLNSDDWKERKQQWLQFWNYRCSICNTGDCILDVHHRTYERLKHEQLSDCVVLCRQCHDHFEMFLPPPDQRLF